MLHFLLLPRFLQALIPPLASWLTHVQKGILAWVLTKTTVRTYPASILDTVDLLSRASILLSATLRFVHQQIRGPRRHLLQFTNIVMSDHGR